MDKILRALLNRHPATLLGALRWEVHNSLVQHCTSINLFLQETTFISLWHYWMIIESDLKVLTYLLGTWDRLTRELHMFYWVSLIAQNLPLQNLSFKRQLHMHFAVPARLFFHWQASQPQFHSKITKNFQKEKTSTWASSIMQIRLKVATNEKTIKYSLCKYRVIRSRVRN